MKKRKPLKLFTKTWQPKEQPEDDPQRPLTATLEKPTILNISFIDKIDMTLMRKEFFALSNLCKLPLTINLKKQPQRRPLSLPPSEINRNRKQTSSEDEASLKTSRKPMVHLLKRQSPKNGDKPLISDTNNNTKLPRKLPPTTKPSYVKSTKLPEPCKTCGRSDQPERLHSHPVTSSAMRSVVKRTMEAPMKSTVQKPVAMRYQSKKAVSPTKKAPTPPQPKKTQNKPKTEEVVRPKSSGKRTLTCYLCSREFGTASLSLHEPKCLEVRVDGGWIKNTQGVLFNNITSCNIERPESQFVFIIINYCT